MSWKRRLLWAWFALSVLWVAASGGATLAGAFLWWLGTIWMFVPPALMFLLGWTGFWIAGAYRRETRAD